MPAPKTKKKPQPLPMPIETVLHSKHLQFAPGSIHRAIITITCHFWASGALLETLDEPAASQVAKIEQGHWNRIKTPVMAALNELLPQLAREHAYQTAKRAAYSESRGLGGRTAWANRRARGETSVRVKKNTEQTEKQPDTVQKSTHTTIQPLRTPQTAREYTNHAAPLRPAELAQITKQNQQVNQAEKENARFVDE